MDLYELLGEDRHAERHVNARAALTEDKKLVKNLVAAREKKGLSQADVARLLGCDRAAVSAFENGSREPRLSTIRRYAAAIGVHVKHVVDEHER